jgi:hypothetical protein
MAILTRKNSDNLSFLYTSDVVGAVNPRIDAVTPAVSGYGQGKGDYDKQSEHGIVLAKNVSPLYAQYQGPRNPTDAYHGYEDLE